MIKREVLKHLYIDKKLSDREIGKKLGKSRQTIWKWRQKYNITRKVNVSKEDFEHLYYDLELSQAEIAERLNIAVSTVCRKMKKLNIKARKPNKKRTTKEFKNEIYNLVGKEYQVLSEYKNNKTSIKMKHITCGYEWEANPISFLRGTRCPKCSGKAKKNTDIFKKEVFELVEDEYEVLGEYHGTQVPIKMIHNECDTIFTPQSSNFLQGARCPNCANNQKKSTEEFKEEVYELVGSEYEVLGKYENNKTKIKLLHNECCNTYFVTPSSFLSGKRCPVCMKKEQTDLKTKSTDEFIKEVYDLVENEYKIIGEYIKSKVPIKIKHMECGNVFEMRPNNFLLGQRCPKCYVSRGEARVKEILEQLNLDYEREFMFDDCKNIQLLPFDFAIFIENEIRMLIEYDGRQHFESIEFFGGDEYLNYVRRNDEIKTNYCMENNLFLLRIPHWKYNEIEGLIIKTLENL
ncbi:helix-turn-helix domain-containing protein [Selenihalanaerobacter shriftii]|uniref:Homeodomain-like domain-containing protein n=1 Tax=Selenihalanaerobacter shriftii TaxID=142842 RepID=A0A1T4NTK9_9FIRM|nr:helix-turn-helix domain-containing protein [Selenihalanaerobacter shriftii]SJZ82485.1 Homeodomain-like domain-containing protein [Selenihalanaerobacter shriftii]